MVAVRASLPSLFNSRNLARQVLLRSWLHFLSHGSRPWPRNIGTVLVLSMVPRAPRCGRRLEVTNGSPASASLSTSCSDAFSRCRLVSLLQCSIISLPSPVPLSMCLRSGLWEPSRTTSNLHCECGRHPVASDVQVHVCFPRQCPRGLHCDT